MLYDILFYSRVGQPGNIEQYVRFITVHRRPTNGETHHNVYIVVRA